MFLNLLPIFKYVIQKLFLIQRPLNYLYEIFDNASPMEHLVGNETMCCRRLTAPHTRKTSRLSSLDLMTLEGFYMKVVTYSQDACSDCA